MSNGCGSLFRILCGGIFTVGSPHINYDCPARDGLKRLHLLSSLLAWCKNYGLSLGFAMKFYCSFLHPTTSLFDGGLPIVHRQISGLAKSRMTSSILLVLASGFKSVRAS